jgi:RNA polymerase sigma factor (TIGR02999 family)
MPDVTEVSRILAEFTEGDRSAADRLMPLIYEELRALASRSMRREPRGHTWATTDLVHEAYLKLIDQRGATIHDREHFLALAAQAVRRVLVDHARRRGSVGRGREWRRVSIDVTSLEQEGGDLDVLALDALLEKLRGLDERQARVVEMRFFAGLSIEETARVLCVSPGTVKGDWFMARAFLRRELGEPSGSRASDEEPAP